jgi:hypothetical protein
MRALALILLLVGTSLTGTGETLDRAIQALIQVESNGRCLAIGDNGKAYGILQIHNVMIQDYNRITGASLVHSDAFNEVTARRVCRSILKHYLQDIRSPTLKHIAFIWNGGGGARHRVEHPRQDAKQANLNAYYKKVRSAYNNQ